MALAPIVLHVWAERVIPLDWTELLAELGALTLDSVVWVADTVTTAPAGLADGVAYVRVSDLTVGSHVVTCRGTLSNGDTLDRSLTLDVRAAVYEDIYDRRGRLISLQLDPDGSETLGVDWSAVLAEVQAHTPPAAIDGIPAWPAVTGFSFAGESVAGSIARARVSTSLEAGATAVLENRVTFDNGERDARNLSIAVGEL